MRSLTGLMVVVTVLALGCGENEAKPDDDWGDLAVDDTGDAQLDTGAPEPIEVSVEAACEPTDYGYETPSADAIAAVERVNCYRNVMGLEPIVLDPQLDAAAQAHADYMLTNEAMSHTEDASLPGYTGDHAWDRAEAAGYPYEGGRSCGEVVSVGLDPAGAVDNWMNSVYHREPFTKTIWQAGGFGQAGDYSSLTAMMPYPQGVHNAVMFPVDGQVDVPTTFNSDAEHPDPAPDHALVGYPVTVSVTDGSIWRDDHNFYDLSLVHAEMWGPDGEAVEILVLTPDEDEILSAMVALVPVEPLQAGTRYTAEVTVTWAGDLETLRSEFTTASF